MFFEYTLIGLPEKIWSVFVAIISLIIGVMDMGTPMVTPEVEYVKQDQFLLLDATYTGQGIATDGEYYYTSGSLTAFGVACLAKWDAETLELCVKNDDAIPSEYREKYITDHIGGISYYNGLIYAAVENDAEDFPLIITYDARTLKMVEVYEVEGELLPDGIPWCAVDAANGYIYTSQFNEAEYIVAYDLYTMEFSHMLPLSEKILRVQGGEVYDGKLYLSNDAADSNDDSIYIVDLGTGDVTKLCTRSLPSIAGNEAEDITVYPMADGTLIHVLDYNKTIGVYLRHYTVK